MVVSSFPHQMNMGNCEFKSMLTEARRLCGHWSGVPIGVCDQSNARVIAPISPPPCRKEKIEGEAIVFTGILAFTLKVLESTIEKLNHNFNSPHLNWSCSSPTQKTRCRVNQQGCFSCIRHPQQFIAKKRFKKISMYFTAGRSITPVFASNQPT